MMPYTYHEGLASPQARRYPSEVAENSNDHFINLNMPTRS